MPFSSCQKMHSPKNSRWVIKCIERSVYRVYCILETCFKQNESIWKIKVRNFSSPDDIHPINRTIYEFDAVQTKKLTSKLLHIEIDKYVVAPKLSFCIEEKMWEIVRIMQTKKEESIIYLAYRRAERLVYIFFSILCMTAGGWFFFGSNS